MLSRRTFLAGVSTAALSGLGSMAAMARGDRPAFRLPEESARHERTFMQWPVNRAVHPYQAFLDPLQQSIADVANTIAEFEPVVMLMDEPHAPAARRKLSATVEVWDIPTDDLWCRDSGPVFVVTEAGGVESDGDGTLIAHESSWVNPNRNRGTRAEVEGLLQQALGAEKTIWAPGVRGADITDYHIDSLARFTRPGHVIIQMPEKPDPSDPWSAAAMKTYDILASSTDARGRKLELTVLPEPYDIRVTTADFVASYVNYYVCNGAVIAAQFGDRAADAEAEAALARLHPGREVVMLNVDPIGEVGGGIHCATQQQPAV